MTKPDAHALLDAARAGANLSTATIVQALIRTGDITTPNWAEMAIERRASSARVSEPA